MRLKILVAAAIFLAMPTHLSCMKREPAQLPSVHEFVESIERCFDRNSGIRYHLKIIRHQQNPAVQDDLGWTILHYAAERDGAWGGPFILSWIVYWAQAYSLEHDSSFVFPESMGSREEKYAFLQNLDPVVHEKIECLLHVSNNWGKTPYDVAWWYTSDANKVLEKLEELFPKPKITHQEPDQPDTETSCVLS